MGLTRRGVAFLAASRGLGVDFERTLTLGRQTLFADASMLESAFAEAGDQLGPEAAERIATDDGFSEGLLRHLGGAEVDSIDASDYEGSTVVHDLNDSLPAPLRERFSVVLDAGTLEHVFNFPQAVRNCLEAVRVGGHFIAITPTNNYLGHGFYQFSPELYHRVLSPENGFEVRCLLLRAERRAAQWYAASDPAELRGRVTLSGAFPCLLYVVAERLDDRQPLAEHPQQSDYTVAWNGEGAELKPRSRRLPGMPVPGLNALEWARLVFHRPSRSGLHAIRLDQLRSLNDG
jgi:hypothetical protein